MDTARIATLLEPFLNHSLTEGQLEHISIYIDLLQHWNARINLTAIRHEEEIVPRHFGESLFLASYLFPNPSHAVEAPSVIDLGSGAGFPGIPLKLWAPKIHLTMVESNQKKSTFLKEVARALTLTNVDVITTRIEDLAKNPNFPKADVVTLRAVDRLGDILPPAMSLLTPQGRMALLTSTSRQDMILATPTIHWSNPHPLPSSKSRVILLGTNNMSKST